MLNDRLAIPADDGRAVRIHPDQPGAFGIEIGNVGHAPPPVEPGLVRPSCGSELGRGDARIPRRLATAKGLGNDTINVRIGLKWVDEVDDEVADLLRRAFAANA
jgi:hypothetical protein